LQEAIDTLPDPLPPGFNAQTVIKKAEAASNILQRASSNSIDACYAVFLPNGKLLILPEGAVHKRKKIHTQLLDLYSSLEAISFASWLVGTTAGLVKIGAAYITGGL
jgi:hypothetical protein